MKFITKLKLPVHDADSVFIEPKIVSVTIVHNPYILDNTIQTIQTVYKYFIDDMLVITYYTNGKDALFFPIYHELEKWPKEKLDRMLEQHLPHIGY